MRRTLKLNDQIKQLAADLKDEQSCLMFGRGRNYATAMEAALKVGLLASRGGEGRPHALLHLHLPACRL